jgi:dTDP-glucose 4,6-dehydratase/UDP-glucuronate decarboxylase
MSDASTTAATASPPPVISRDLDEIVGRALEPLQELRGKVVLVAGAAGFLPSYVVDAIARSNESLEGDPCVAVCLDNFVTGVADRLAHLDGRDDVRFVRHDITQPIELEERVDYVVHGASIASPTWYRRFPLETIDVNVSGTRNLLELARAADARGLLYLSSSEIYGDPPPERVPTTEDYWGNVSCTGPRAPYDESKRVAETLCTTFVRQYGTPVKIVRPFNVYGPGLRLDDGRVIPDFVSNALAGTPITVLGHGRSTRSFCYVADFVAGLLHLLVHDATGEAFNLGNDEEVSIRTVAETAAELGGALGVTFATSDDPHYLTDNPERRCPDLSKTKAAIDWSPTISLRDGLARTLEHYRSSPA